MKRLAPYKHKTEICSQRTISIRAEAWSYLIGKRRDVYLQVEDERGHVVTVKVKVKL